MTEPIKLPPLPKPEAYLYFNGEHKAVSLNYRRDSDLSSGTIRHSLITHEQAEAYTTAAIEVDRQAQVSDTGWKEAAIAWEVCASIHRQYCKGKDPLFTTRQDDFVKHAADARAHALQSQDREDAERLKLRLETIRALYPNAPSDVELDAAIDHARRIEDKP